MNCDKCGKDISEGFQFCPFCGKKVAIETAPNPPVYKCLMAYNDEQLKNLFDSLCFKSVEEIRCKLLSESEPVYVYRVSRARGASKHSVTPVKYKSGHFKDLGTTYFRTGEEAEKAAAKRDKEMYADVPAENREIFKKIEKLKMDAETAKEKLGLSSFEWFQLKKTPLTLSESYRILRALDKLENSETGEANG